jgi:hypothetical protein
MPTTQEPVIVIDHIAIPLSAVNGVLRRSYELAAHEVSVTTGPQQNVAKAKMNDLATQILREAAGSLALKISPRSHGAQGLYEGYNKRIG